MNYILKPVFWDPLVEALHRMNQSTSANPHHGIVRQVYTQALTEIDEKQLCAQGGFASLSRPSIFSPYRTNPIAGAIRNLI